MTRLSKFRMLRAGAAVLIAVVGMFVLQPANAQTATPQADTQNQLPVASEGEGGAGGGQLVAAGTPEAVARDNKSYTGQYLSDLLKPPSPRRRSAAL